MIASPSPGAIRPTARDNAKAALRISEGFNMESKHNRLIGYLVYDAQKHITKSLEVTLKPYDITPGQWNLINQLDQSWRAVAERAGHHHPQGAGNHHAVPGHA